MRRKIGGLVYNKKWHFWDSIISGLKMYLYLHNAHSMWASFCTFPFSPWLVEPGNRESDESHSDPFLFSPPLIRSHPFVPVFQEVFLEHLTKDIYTTIHSLKHNISYFHAFFRVICTGFETWTVSSRTANMVATSSALRVKANGRPL